MMFFHTLPFLCFLCLFVATSAAHDLVFLTAFFPDLLVFSFTVFLTGFFATFLTFSGHCRATS